MPPVTPIANTMESASTGKNYVYYVVAIPAVCSSHPTSPESISRSSPIREMRTGLMCRTPMNFLALAEFNAPQSKASYGWTGMPC